MKRNSIIFSIFILLLITGKTEANKMENNIFESEMKLYTIQEAKEQFPSLGVDRNQDIFYNYRYLFGWVRLNKNIEIRKKWLPSCRIKLWNKHFRYKFDIIGVAEEKSYFLIPIGSFNPDRNFDYSISTIP